MEIKRIESQPTSKGPAEWFTGSVRIQPLFESPEPARVRGASVTFAPGCTHSLACTSAWSDVDRHIRSRLGAA